MKISYDRNGKNGDLIEIVWDDTIKCGNGVLSHLKITENECQELSSLQNGSRMFQNCDGLTSFCSDISSLVNGSRMFQDCNNLTTFNSLSSSSSLENGSWMFSGTALETFNSDLSSLTDGSWMFAYCSSLESFNCDLSKLKDGTGMFYQTNLESFTSNLTSLRYGRGMFGAIYHFCPLDKDSIVNILSSLKNNNTLPSGEIGQIDMLIPYEYNNNKEVTDNFYWWDGNEKDGIHGAIITQNGGVWGVKKYEMIITEPYNTTWSSKYNINSLKNNDAITITSVEDDFLYQGDEIAYVITPSMKNLVDVSGGDGDGMFSYTAIESFNSDLSGLQNGTKMFNGCDNLNSVNTTLTELKNGSNMFSGTNVREWDITLPSLCDGDSMFCNSSLTSFNVSLPILTNGSYMFRGTNVDSFNIKLPSLTNGHYMFCDTPITEWNVDLQNLANGVYMFQGCSSLTSFSGDLSSLISANGMFYYTSLASWNVTLPKLISGSNMFNQCSELSSISAEVNLGLLQTGYQMFTGCKLTPDSVHNISTAIKDISALDRTNDEDWQYSIDGGNTVVVIAENDENGNNQRGVIHIDWDSEKYSTKEVDVYNYGIDTIEKGWDIHLNDEYLNDFLVQSDSYNRKFSSTNGIDNENILSVKDNVMFNNSGEVVKLFLPRTDVIEDVSGGNVEDEEWGGMFYRTGIQSFDSDLSSLKNGDWMFYYTSLASWNVTLPKLISGSNMFNQCSELSSISAAVDLGSLQAGNDMFTGCKLTPDSVHNISTSIKDIKDFVDWDASIAEDNRGRIDIDWDSEKYSSLTNDVTQYCRNIARKGWNISLGGEIITEYIILTEPYNKEWSVNNNLNSITEDDALRITSVLNSEIYQDDEKIIEMYPPTNDIVDVSGGNGSGMFSYTALASFNSDLSKLKNGNHMFWGCKNLTNFDAELPALKCGLCMFDSCSSLVSFTKDLTNLIYGGQMFCQSGLTSFEKNLGALIDGWHMFSGSPLVSFTSDLNSLVNGKWMFMGCESLVTFEGNLSSLKCGDNMFDGCKLTPDSVKNIADTIKNISALDRTNDKDWQYSRDGGVTTTTIDVDERGRIDIDWDSINYADSTNTVKQYCINIANKGWDVYLNNIQIINEIYVEFTSSGDIASSNLMALEDGSYMFANNDNVTTFNDELLSLVKGYNMFYGCKLNVTSVQNIANSINDLSDDVNDGTNNWGKIHIGIEKSLKGDSDINSALATIREKGWTVYDQYNA